MLFWGEPWDINSWEVTENFAKKWSWFVKDAFLSMMSTSEWRRRRGESSPSFDLTWKEKTMSNA